MRELRRRLDKVEANRKAGTSDVCSPMLRALVEAQEAQYGPVTPASLELIRPVAWDDAALAALTEPQFWSVLKALGGEVTICHN